MPPSTRAIMLETFYPQATPADLARAQRERPEYFIPHDGPLTPLDPQRATIVLPAPDFAGLTADAIARTSGQYDRVDLGYRTIVESSQPTRITAASAQLLEPATGAQASHAIGFADADPIEILAHLDALGPALDVSAAVFTDPPPEDFPVLVIPPPPPGGPDDPGGRD